MAWIYYLEGMNLHIIHRIKADLNTEWQHLMGQNIE